MVQINRAGAILVEKPLLANGILPKNSNGALIGSLYAAEIAPVPEASTIALCSAALALVILRRVHNKKSAGA